MKGGLVLSESASSLWRNHWWEKKMIFLTTWSQFCLVAFWESALIFLRCQLFSTRFCCCLLVKMCEISSRFDIWYTCMNLCGYVLYFHKFTQGPFKTLCWESETQCFWFFGNCNFRLNHDRCSWWQEKTLITSSARSLGQQNCKNPSLHLCLKPSLIRSQ